MGVVEKCLKNFEDVNLSYSVVMSRKKSHKKFIIFRTPVDNFIGRQMIQAKSLVLRLRIP